MIKLPRKFGMFLIRLYQKTISPDHGFFKEKFAGGYCPFYPSCSQYGYEAVKKFGLIRGGFKTAWRILRCHPWTKGGVDNP